MQGVILITVGVRELKQNLSQYLSSVKSGERIIVTDRKKEVAVISPYKIETVEEKALILIRRGIAHWSGGKPKGMNPKIHVGKARVSEAIIEDRR